jgi:hypothetical protein
MGIQSFTPSSGGLPGLEFINQVLLTTATRNWAQGGGAGVYTIKSAKNEAGYVYFIGATTVGGPLNGVIDVPATFTSIKLIGAVGDLASLYKVSVKPTTSFSTTTTVTTYTSTQSGVNLTTNKTGFIDALMVAGGGGRAQHGGGGGGGGVLILNSFPLAPGTSFNVQVGSAGSNDTTGGDTIFAGTKAPGGGGGSSDSTTNGKAGGSGGGGVNTGAAGGTTQGTGVNAVANPILFYSSYGSVATAQGHGNIGGGGLGSAHQGGGGGGAGGPASGINGGPGLLSSFTGTPVYYAAGGYGGRHSSQGHGSSGTGWSSGGYGNGGNTNDNNYNGPQATSGVVIVRSYDL